MENRIKLISSDDEEFHLDYDIAIQSQTLRSFFGRPSTFVESISREIVLPIRSSYLRRVIEFLKFKYLTDTNGELGEFKVDDDETLELLDIAAYLKI